jgi:hypothetical protein
MTMIDNEGTLVNPQQETRPEVDLDTVVGHINDLAIKTVERGALEIGEYVLDAVFKGSLDKALSKNPNKSQSLQDVCNHQKLMVNRRTLGGWVRAANLKRTLVSREVDCSNLTLSHFTALLQVKDEATRDDLAAKANDGRWCVHKLSVEVDMTKGLTVPDFIVKEMKRMVQNPLDFEDDRAVERLSDTRALAEDLSSTDRLGMVKGIDITLPRIEMFLNLLKTTKRNLVRIELGEPSPEEA